MKVFTATAGSKKAAKEKAAELIVDVVRGEGVAAGKDIPSVIVVGSDAYKKIADELASAQHRVEDWKALTCSTDF